MYSTVIICPRPLRTHNHRNRSTSITTINNNNHSINSSRKHSISEDSDPNHLSPELDEFFSIMSGVGLNGSNNNSNNNRNSGGGYSRVHNRKRSSTGSFVTYRSRSASGYNHNIKPSTTPGSPPFPIYSPVSRYLTRNPLTRHEESSILAKLAAMQTYDLECEPTEFDLSAVSTKVLTEDESADMREDEVEECLLMKTKELVVEEVEESKQPQ